MTSFDHMASPPGEVTRLLRQFSEGNQDAVRQLVPLVYERLRRIAARQMRAERPDHSLQPTALVHEVYLKLLKQKRVTWESRTQFYSVAARLMRRVLVDHARQFKSSKRGKGQKISLESTLIYSLQQSVELLAIDEALTRLAEKDPRSSRVVELRFFGGCSEEEIAVILGISARTVKRHWRVARAWLYAELSKK